MPFGFGKKKQQAAPPPSLDLRQEGVGYADLTTREAVEAAVAQGRLEWFWFTSPQFGGPQVPENQLAGPPGVGAARDWIDDQVIAVIDRGGRVTGDADIVRDESGSWVPRTVTYDFGPEVGVHTLRFW